MFTRLNFMLYEWELTLVYIIWMCLQYFLYGSILVLVPIVGFSTTWECLFHSNSFILPTYCLGSRKITTHEIARIKINQFIKQNLYLSSTKVHKLSHCHFNI